VDVAAVAGFLESLGIMGLNMSKRNGLTTSTLANGGRLGFESALSDTDWEVIRYVLTVGITSTLK
jgi:hypothetical protein